MNFDQFIVNSFQNYEWIVMTEKRHRCHICENGFLVQGSHGSECQDYIVCY
jgi:hypothetical protein